MGKYFLLRKNLGIPNRSTPLWDCIFMITKLRLLPKKFVHHSEEMSVFFGFDIDVVRASDAPGTSAPSPLGLRAGEFIQLVKYAASLANTRMVEFSEMNPDYDVDDRTAKLVAIAIHRLCSQRA